ncbi:MAG: glycoside hydrolase family 15 protein [Deltaproteobacteria bacterium]|nr:glycoside hydrolase family 15 protein [Deltaproteobacteria bacterium]MBW2447744.1 glycoside hydrolase family 15 protein [Deltaproteobacteria bacterium]
MDLYTQAARLGRPFRVGGAATPLGQHALVGDGATAALVGVDGSLDWLCFPRFDSPSVFAAILDPDRGGRFQVAPAARPFESLQAYDSQTNVLQTLFTVPDQGVACLTDFMPWVEDPRFSVHEVHRLLEVHEGSLQLEVIFDPRFDYGRGETRVEPAEHGAVAIGPNGERCTLALGSGVRVEPRSEGGVVAHLHLRQGERTWAILSWGGVQPEPVLAYRPYDHMRTTRRFWRNWASKLRYDGPWRHDVQRSALTLKLLQYAPSGAVVAAPTTSLPESPQDGTRNWDYRYSWVRDSAMAIRAMNLIGYPEEARGFFHFVRETIDRRGQLDLMVTIEGGEVPDEMLLPGLAGHAGRGPVRIGNAARDQRQNDITGLLLDAIALHERQGGAVDLGLWRQIRVLVNLALEWSAEPDHGIWEPRAAPQHHTHSKLMAWVALDRAVQMAPLFGETSQTRLWREKRDALHAEIMERAWNEKIGSFASVYGGADVDSTLLLFPTYGFLDASDPHVKSTRERVVKELGEGRFLRRYRSDDGIGTQEGAFVLCGFWLAEALALAGQLDEALQVFTDHQTATNHVGLLSEEVDPATGQPLGNFPQAFSHLGLIQAAARLDLALRLRDEGIEHPPQELDLP